MKKRDFLKTGTLAIAASLVAPFVPKFIRNPQGGIWVETDRNIWQYTRPLAASTILSRTISSVEDKRIVLSNSNFARALPASLGAWSSIRIAVRAIGNTALTSNLTGNPLFAIGLCSGTSGLVLDTTSSNWCGGIVRIPGSQDWAYVANAGNPYFGRSGESSFYAAKRLNSTWTYGATIGSQWGMPSNATQARRRIYMVDITKGSPNFAFDNFICNIGSSTSDVTLETFLSYAPQTTPAALTDHAAQNLGVLAVSEGDGTLNTLNIGWDKSSFTIEISDLAIVKLA